MPMSVIFPDLTSKLIHHRPNNQHHSCHLDQRGPMIVEDDTDYHGENFTGCDHERDDMLFEEFYHCVHHELAQCAQDGETQQMDDEDWVVEEIDCYGFYCQGYGHRD